MLVLVQFEGDQPLPTQIPIEDIGAFPAPYPLIAVNLVTAQLVRNGVNVWTAERRCDIVDVQSGLVAVSWVASDFATPGSNELYLRVYWNNSTNVETLGPAELRIQGFPLLTSIPQAAPGTSPPDATVGTLTVVAGFAGRIASGVGVPTLPGGQAPQVGDYFLRSDAPSVAGQRLYVCVVGGSTPTWTGIL